MDWIAAVQTVGVAGACLIALGVAVWRSMTWVGHYILKPVAERHIKFLDELSTAMASQSQALQTMAIQQGKNLDGIERIMDELTIIIGKQDKLVDEVAKAKRDMVHNTGIKTTEPNS